MAPDGTQQDTDDIAEGVREPSTDKPNTKRVNFSIDTTKASVSTKDTDDGQETYLTVPISSLEQDRDNDEITDGGMDSLVSQVENQPIGMFPNHGMDPDSSQYDYRNIIGAWENATLDGDTTMGKVRLRKESADSDELVDDAAELKDLIEQDMPVGFSIGFGWDEKDVEERDDGGLRFHDMDLMEISAVGIPSNPEAVVQAGQNVAQAMKSAGVDPSSLDTDTLAENLKQSMTDETDGDETPDETDEQDSPDGGEETNQIDEETAERVTNAVRSVAESHAEAMVTDTVEAVADAMDMDGDEDEEDDESEDDEEETDGDDMDDEDEEDDEKSEDVEALKSELEELRAELETVKTDAADSSGRKAGGMTPAETDDDETDETREPSNEYEEAFAFTED